MRSGCRVLLVVLVALISGCALSEPEAEVATAVPVPTGAAGAAPDDAISSPTPTATATPSPTPTPTPTTTRTPAATLPPPLPEDFSLGLELVADGLSSPVFATAPPDDERLFIVERDGRIRVLSDGAVRGESFLDIAAQVRAGNEQGLLGLAFHPDYAHNGRLFVYYTAEPDGRSVVEEYAAAPDGDRADPDSARTLLTVEQPHRWHNGGMIEFAPDGMLLIALGDGGGADDPAGAGQDPGTLLATLARIDVDRTDGELAYGIPADNPFADGADGAPEVWAYGLRNPWRFAIDAVAGLLYIADVGEYEREELNVVAYPEPGANFGWPVLEGTLCRGGDDPACESDDLIAPVIDYDRGPEACAIIGGYPYRGAAMPELHGTYFYGDYCFGWIRSLRLREGQVSEERDWSAELPAILEMSSFGVDADGELYVLSLRGTIHRVVRGD